MAKEKRSEEVVTNFDWDSPPNNRFTPWPIQPNSPTGTQKRNGDNQETCKSSQGERRDC